MHQLTTRRYRQRTLGASTFKYLPILDLAFLCCPIQRQSMGLFYALNQGLQNGTLHFCTEVFAA